MLALQVVLGFATALAFSAAMTPLIIRFASACGLYDVPDGAFRQGLQQNVLSIKRRVHTSPVPRLGGLAIILSFFLTSLIWSYGTALYPVLAISIIIFAVGFLDDVFSLSAGFRLLVQIVCAGGAVGLSSLAIEYVTISPQIAFQLPGPLGFFLAVFIIVGAINAINMIDGLDGLAGGVVLIAVSLLSFIYYLRTQETFLLLYLSVPIAGAILGFLRYNTHPAAIFMGDGGSNWLGFMTGVLLLMVLGDLVLVKEGGEFILERATAIKGIPYVPIISVLLCLAVPVFDTAFVMLSRMRDGLSPMMPDKRHFHHSLLQLGFSHSQSVTAVYFVAIAVGIIGVLPIVFPQYDFSLLPYLAVGALSLVLATNVAQDGGWIRSFLVRRMTWRQSEAVGRHLRSLLRVWDTFNRYLLYTILLVPPIFVGALKDEIGYAALAAAFLLVISLVFRRRKHDFLDSFILCIGAVVLLVANNQNKMNIELLGARHDIQFIYNGLFVALFISTLVMLLVTIKRRYFVFTPSDFLLLTVPMILLLVPEPVQTQYRLNIICLRSLIVFMALRTMVKRRRAITYHTRLIALFALVFVALVGLFDLRIVY